MPKSSGLARVTVGCVAAVALLAGCGGHGKAQQISQDPRVGQAKTAAEACVQQTVGKDGIHVVPGPKRTAEITDFKACLTAAANANPALQTELNKYVSPAEITRLGL